MANAATRTADTPLATVTDAVVTAATSRHTRPTLTKVRAPTNVSQP